MEHINIKTKVKQSPFESWREYNTSGTASVAPGYAMPPDIYRYTNLIGQVDGNNVIQHGKTTTAELKVLSEQMKQAAGGDKTHYYRSIADKAGRIVNFFNTGDAALTAWEFNQLTKPDYLEGFDGSEGSEWDYSNEQTCGEPLYDEITGEVVGAIGGNYPDGSPCPGPTDLDINVTSRFYQDGTEISWDPTIPQTGQPYTQEQRNYLEIMGHIIPARTKSLAQLDVEDERKRPNNPVPFLSISNTVPMGGFTNSNQGHSAQFYGYLSEPERGRGNYWLQVMVKGIGLNPELTGSYSGLYPNTNVTGTQP
jgi:hypothetical protein